MSASSASKSFNDCAPASRKPATRAKRPAPFSIRLATEERALLKRKAGNRSLGAYIRSKLLDEKDTRPRKPSKAPAIDYVALGQVLGMLGKSELATNLCLLAVAAEAGNFAASEEERAMLRAACEDVQDMRIQLVKALGLKPGAAS